MRQLDALLDLELVKHKSSYSLRGKLRAEAGSSEADPALRHQPPEKEHKEPSGCWLRGCLDVHVWKRHQAVRCACLSALAYTTTGEYKEEREMAHNQAVIGVLLITFVCYLCVYILRRVTCGSQFPPFTVIVPGIQHMVEFHSREILEKPTAMFTRQRLPLGFTGLTR